ncbi:Dehydration-induced protein [Parasponia andersonii]|uniref:Dehydration-induced protein n=1 Tax=Parasponia andersonii TaxID=3476 RepID=A0A2P5AVG0_PARAD|nr:Dehydration-induced protein [Parasponia andersonii]
MEDDSWSFGLSASSRGFQSTLQSQSDFFIDLEDFDGDDDVKVDFPCPFCMEDFDIVGLCYHIDEEHPSEPNPGHKLKHHKDEYSTLSFSRKELQDEPYRYIFDGSFPPASTSKMVLDPLLSFIYSAPSADKSDNAQGDFTAGVSVDEKSSEQTPLESNSHPSPLSDKDQEEKAQRCNFVQGLLLSTFLDDGL